MNIYKIVLTGGPCAGKTKIQEYVTKELRKDNYYVILVPETARYFIENGIIPNKDRNHTLKFQEYILRFQMEKERIAEEYAKTISNEELEFIKNKKAIIILYDRGIIDNRAYLEHNDYNNLLNNNNCNEIAYMDKYDLVIDLISTATSKEELYELDGIRYETLEEAKEKDMLITSAWSPHHNIKVIHPTNTIEEKQEKVLKYIYNLINNYQIETMNKSIYDEKTLPKTINTNNSRIVDIENLYLDIDNEYNTIISKRTYNKNSSYIIKEETIKQNITYKRNEKQISEEYANNLINNYGIKKVSKKQILSIINQGNIYEYIKENYTINLDNDYKEKSLTKKRNMII